MEQQQQPQMTAEQEAAYKKAFDEFAKVYTTLNTWGQIDFLFQMKAQLDGISAELAKKSENSILTTTKPS